MAKKSSLQKIQETVVDTVKAVVKDPAGAANKAAEQAKGAFAVGKMVAGQVTKSAAGKVASVSGLKSTPPVPPREDPVAKPLEKSDHKTAQKSAEKSAEVTPNDVARVVAKKPPAKKAPAKKAPAKKASTPSAKLPPRKAPAEAEAPAEKAPAKKAPAKKATGTDAKA